MSSVIHVTHEAVVKVGGIGAVLEGLITTCSYQADIGRTILVGPLFSPEDEDALAAEGEIGYSSSSGRRSGETGKGLQLVERKYHTPLVYGWRRMVDGAGHARAVEVLLVDVSQVNRELENRFKFDLYQRFGLQSDRYESTWDYLQYLRLAEPAYEALQALLGDSPGPHFVLSHEYMGMPLALKSISAADPRFRTIFHAHEVAAVRPIVENAPGHDAMFYNVMALAMDDGLSIGDVFGDQSGFYRHALVERSHRCDSVFAVGDRIVDELRFLGPGLRDAPIDLVYNGVPAVEISAEEKKASVDRLRSYAQALTGVRPQVVFTHVSRPVASKGFWRDLQVLEHLDRAFAADGRTGVLYLLSTAAGSRTSEDVLRMEAEYGWPLDHRAGYPDLEGPEVDLWAAASAFNQGARAIRVVFVNQFGWDRGRCGRRMPAEMSFADLRRGTQVEFGLSIYEPFGIAQVEPLSCGALCVVSDVCGCRGYVRRAAGEQDFANLIVAAYTDLGGTRSMEELRRMDAPELERIEAGAGAAAAGEILEGLPRSEEEEWEAVQRGYGVARNMSWERVCEDFFLPGLGRAARRR